MSEFYGPHDETESLKALHVAYDLGYRHFDTADIYGNGNNERLISRFLADRGRFSELFIATKVGIRRVPGEQPRIEVDSSPEYVHKACEASLKRLGIECVDLLYLHRRSLEIPITETIGAMAGLVRAGKARFIGLSEVSETTLRDACREYQVSALQSEYSIWTREIENGVLAACGQLGVSLVASSPLGRGFFTGAVTSQKLSQSAGDLRPHLPRFQSENLEANARLLVEVERVAEEAGCTMAQVALAWVLARASHVHVIPGTRCPSHISENLAAASVRLSEKQCESLVRAFAPGAVHGARYPDALMKTVNL